MGIGASAGGLEAFTELLRRMPADSGMAFVLIQHLDPTHPSVLGETLARSVELPVHEIRDGMRLEPNHIYVIPANADVGILKGALTVHPRQTERRTLHLPIDFFFRALAADRGNLAIGIVLSGTASDGTEGLRAIKDEGGVTFAQEPKTAKFSGMPESAVSSGAVDFVAPIPELANELLRIAKNPYVRRSRDAEVLGAEDESDLQKLFVLLRTMAGSDFSDYKRSSIQRRVSRRMALRSQPTLRDYVALLQADPAEARTLSEELLIHVTSFFREPEVFERLKEVAFPQIVERKRHGGAIRAWVAGCSTGEEAYSLGIALLEYLAQDESTARIPIQIFGTDISERAIEKARAGSFPDGAVRDLAPERLARFFEKLDGGGYRIHKSVRDLCAFVRHDLASDPPFSKLDLICCRNVLIYFDQPLQRRVMATFHFALNLPGFLLLGRAENLADGTGFFTPVDRDAKIFARTAAPSTMRLAPARELAAPFRASAEPEQSPGRVDVVRRTESLLLERYAPPGVIVNERMEILHFRGRTGPYLEPAPGQPRHDLLKMARAGLLRELQLGMAEARRGSAAVRRTGVGIRSDGKTHLCDLVIVPVAGPPELRERVFAVLFEEPALDRHPVAAQRREPRPRSPGDVARLNDELQATKEYLQSVIEEHQRTNDELVSANEELVSSNEELQSLNEELETAKEELQSTNEELTTLNEELQTRNTELNQVNGDILNILGSVEVPIVIVDGARRIRRFTPGARPILNLLPSDVGRPVDDIKPNLDMPDLDASIAEVIDAVAPKEWEVRDRKGKWYRLQIRPYMTVEKRIDGAVLSIVDIDALKRSLGAAEWARDFAASTVDAVQTPLAVLGQQMEVVRANDAFVATFGIPRAEAVGTSLYALQGGVWDVPALRAALAQVAEQGASFQKLELERPFPKLGSRTFSLSARTVRSSTDERLVLLALEDITDRRAIELERARLLSEAERAKAEAEEANRTKDLFLATLSHELRTPLTSLTLQAQRLRRGGLDATQLRQLSERIDRATRAQAQLIDDLLDVSRIITGKLKMERQPLKLPAIIRAALETVTAAAEAKSLEVRVALDEALPPVWGDPIRLQQVVWNLLVNAVKFTPDGGRVDVTLDAADGKARLRVADTGIGIDPTFLPSVFERFNQEVQTSTRVHGGLGLGLAIAKHMVEAHDGSIRVESPGKGKGATFTVLLPFLAEPSRDVLGPDKPPEAVATRDLHGARVLVVEDDPGTREALVDMLSLAGAALEKAGSAARAMELFESFAPELIVCDIAMPDEDGYSLLRRIRARGVGRGGDVPAVALTALAGDEDRRRALEAGFQVHMPKPFDIEQLVAVLSRLRPPHPVRPEQ